MLITFNSRMQQTSKQANIYHPLQATHCLQDPRFPMHVWGLLWTIEKPIWQRIWAFTQPAVHQGQLRIHSSHLQESMEKWGRITSDGLNGRSERTQSNICKVQQLQAACQALWWETEPHWRTKEARHTFCLKVSDKVLHWKWTSPEAGEENTLKNDK